MADDSTGLTTRIATVLTTVISSLLIASVVGIFSLARQVQDHTHELRHLSYQMEDIKRKLNTILGNQMSVIDLAPEVVDADSSNGRNCLGLGAGAGLAGAPCLPWRRKSPSLTGVVDAQHRLSR